MKMDRAELAELLLALKPGLARKKVVEQMNHYVFTGSHLVTYNDRTMVSFPYETDFSCSVKAQRLLSLCSKTSVKEIDMTVSQGEVRFLGQGVAAGMSLLKEDVLSESISSVMEQVGESNWKPLPDGFMQGLELCGFCCAADETLGTATCVRVVGQHMMSGIQQRVSLYRMGGTVEDELLVKGSAISGMLDFMLTEYNVSKSWLYFRSDDGLMFSIRRVVGDFLEIEALFERLNGIEYTTISFPKDEIKQSLSLVTDVFEEMEEPWVRVRVEPDFIQLSTESGKSGDWASKVVEHKQETPVYEFAINPTFFSQILDIVPTARIINPETPLIFSSESFHHIVAPLRMDPPKRKDEDGDDIPF